MPLPLPQLPVQEAAARLQAASTGTAGAARQRNVLPCCWLAMAVTTRGTRTAYPHPLKQFPWATGCALPVRASTRRKLCRPDYPELSSCGKPHCSCRNEWPGAVLSDRHSLGLGLGRDLDPGTPAVLLQASLRLRAAVRAQAPTQVLRHLADARLASMVRLPLRLLQEVLLQQWVEAVPELAAGAGLGVLLADGAGEREQAQVQAQVREPVVAQDVSGGGS